MYVKYSYDDFSTKGHGVIEYGSSHKKSGSARKNKKNKFSSDKTSFSKNYNDLLAVHEAAEAERRIEYYKNLDDKLKKTNHK